jgi:hypothetical protein
LTPPEVARLLVRLDGRRGKLSERQIRLLATQGCIVPSLHRSTTTGDPALYTAVDVMLLRLFTRLVLEGLPRWLAKHVIAMRQGELRRVFTKATPAVLQVAAMSAEVVTPDAAEKWPYRRLAGTRQPAPVVSLDLMAIARGVTEAMVKTREAQPTIWAGWRPASAMQAVQA